MAIEAVATKQRSQQRKVGHTTESWLHENIAQLTETSLTRDEILVLATFVTTICHRFPDLLESVVLYGSAARGDERWQSDVDLLVLTTRELTAETEDAFHAIAHTSEWGHECVLSLLIFPPSKQQWHRQGSSFWLNVQTDGIWLYSATGTTHADRKAWPSRFTPERGYQMTDAQYDEIRIHMERTTEDLDAAELMLRSFLERPAISHCYYAVFHAASALLLTKGIVRARHSGVRSELGLHFFATKILPPEWSKLYTTLQEERESATYNMEYEPGEAVAEERLAWAKEFVEVARQYLVENKFLR